MKKFFFLLLASTFTAFVASAQTESATPVGGPVMNFETVEVDYGTIDKGADPLRVFKFTNTGTEPLVIQSAKGSCGCTVPTYPKEPVMPGETAKIEVRYDTQRVGPFTKTVTLVTNETAATTTRVLTIKGTVKDAPAQESVPASQPSILTTTPKN